MLALIARLTGIQTKNLTSSCSYLVSEARTVKHKTSILLSPLFAVFSIAPSWELLGLVWIIAGIEEYQEGSNLTPRLNSLLGKPKAVTQALIKLLR